MPEGYKGVGIGMESDEELAFRKMYPAKNRFQLLEMLNAINPRAKTPLAVLGVFRRKYGSKTLTMFQEELMMINISENREGRAEASEIVGAIRRQKAEEED